MEHHRPEPARKKVNAGHSLRLHKSKILIDWENRVRMEIPTARTQRHYILNNSFSEFIDELIHALETRNYRTDSCEEISTSHSMQRSAIPYYGCDQLLWEYSIIEQIISEVLERETALATHEREFVHEFIQRAKAAAEKEFFAIAERKNGKTKSTADELLVLSEEQIRQLADYLPQIIWTATPDGNVEYYNQRFYEYTGVNFAIAKGWGWQHLFPPEDADRAKKAWTESIGTGKPYELEYRIRRKDGEFRWHLGRAMPVLDRRGRITKWIGTNTDIHESKLAQQERDRLLNEISSERRALKTEKALLKTILEQMPTAVWITEAPSGKVIITNPFALEFMVQPQEPAEGIKDYSEYAAFHLDGTPYTPSEFPGARAILHGETIVDEELLILRPDGSRGFGRFSSAPIRDPLGKITAAVTIAVDLTPLKQAEEALKQSEERFRQLFQNAPVGIAEVDPITHRFRKVNPRYCEMTGYSEAELLHFKVEEITYVEDSRDDTEKLDEIAEGKRDDFRKEKRYLRKDGTLVWAEVSVTTIKASTGAPIFNIAVAQDVSERKTVEQKLIEAQNRLTLALNAANIGIFDYNLNTGEVNWSAEEAQIFGFPKDQLKLNIKDVYDRVYPEDIIQMNQSLQKAIDTGADYRSEFRIVWPDGTTRWAVGMGKITQDETGKALRLLGTNVDITIRKHQEQALTRALKDVQDFKFALDTSSIVAVTDRRGVITYVNDKFCEISKFSRSELIGKTHNVINSSYHPKEFFAQLWQTILSGKVWRGEIQNRAKDGSLYWVDTVIVPFLDTSGKPYQFVAIRNDITERKKHESELFQAIQTREEVLAVVSHDLRNPLGAIMMSASLLERSIGKELPPNFLKKQADKIMSSGKRMNRLIEDILDLSKMDAGHFTLDRSSRCGKNLVEEIAELMKPFAEEKSIQLEVITQCDDFTINCDHDHLMRVFTNLVGNAIKFTSEYGIVRLEVSVSDGFVHFSVTDTGPGIAEHHLPHIFDRYWQAKRTAHKGTGLGLAIAKGIIEEHGGKISVKSEFGRGTTFLFSIPLSDGSETSIDCESP
jgi:PAS domain S-box-containing protein